MTDAGSDEVQFEIFKLRDVMNELSDAATADMTETEDRLCRSQLASGRSPESRHAALLGQPELSVFAILFEDFVGARLAF